MTAPKSVDSAQFPTEQADTASPDLLRARVKTFANALMSAEADALRGAPSGSSARSGSTPVTRHRGGSDMAVFRSHQVRRIPYRLENAAMGLAQ
jgi:hypothetical protein